MDSFSIKEKKIINKFIKNGYIIFNINNKNILKIIKSRIIIETSKILKLNKKKYFKKNFFNYSHEYLKNTQLNSFRLKIYNKLNSDKNFLKNYYLMGKDYIDLLCGNELAIQKKINLSIQLPNDNSSILPIHTDVWSGNSPFEIVFWVPLVNVEKTKSMFILSPEDNKYYFNNIKKFKTSEKLFAHSKKKLKWLKVNYGQGLIFSQTLLHGNSINLEKTSRWSFNCRFKSLYAPYDKKKIGEYFIPLNLRASSKIGMAYEDPKI